MGIFILTLSIILLYTGLLSAASKAWQQEHSEPNHKAPRPPISIIVIARNEAANIADCLRSIYTAAQDYEHEIILMDDHSDDQTLSIARILEIPTLRILQLGDYDIERFGHAYKKAGQYHAIQECKHDYIYQTDADCVVPPHWIDTLLPYLRQAQLVGAPIHIKYQRPTLLEKWQTYENMGTMLLTNLGISTGWWTSANAGNMAYHKSAYRSYIRSQEQHSFASGDDVFFAQWCHEHHSIAYSTSPQSIVTTSAEQTLSSLLAQRTRWATKTTSYGSDGLSILMPALFTFHLLILILLLQSWWSWVLGVAGFALLFCKWLVDTAVITSAAPSYGEKYPILLSPVLSMAHTCYVVWAGFTGLFSKKYNWKNRRVQ